MGINGDSSCRITMSVTDSASTRAWAASKPFLTGSLAGSFATCCIQPMDMIKVRIQLQAAAAGCSGNPLTVGTQVIRNEGFAGLYAGLSAGLVRQVVYTGSRLGLYDKFIELAQQGEEAKAKQELPMIKTTLCAITAGGIAALIGTPADLSLVRMQADNLLPKAEQRGYKSVFHALSSIVRAEGFSGLFKGAGPTATRAMGLNLGMLGGNTEAKKHLGALGFAGPQLVLCASAVAGFFCLSILAPLRLRQDGHAKPKARRTRSCVVQKLNGLRYQNNGQGWASAFLRWLSNVLCAHCSACNDHAFGARPDQEAVEKNRKLWDLRPNGWAHADDFKINSSCGMHFMFCACPLYAYA